MTKKPLYGNGFLNVPIKGEVFDSTNRQPSSYTPSAVPDMFPKDKMLFFVLTNYLPLTAGETLHKKGLLKIEIKDSMVPPESPVRLNSMSFICKSKKKKKKNLILNNFFL